MSLPAAARSEGLIRFVYHDILHVIRAYMSLPDEDNIRYLISRYILVSRNDRPGKFNESILSKFPDDFFMELQGALKLSGIAPQDLISYLAEYLQHLRRFATINIIFMSWCLGHDNP